MGGELWKFAKEKGSLCLFVLKEMVVRESTRDEDDVQQTVGDGSGLAIGNWVGGDTSRD